MLADSNPSGYSNSDVIKPFITARDITERPRDRWIVDFGPDAPVEYAASFGTPFQHVETNVKPSRTGTALDAQKPFWVFQRSRPALRDALSNLTRFVVTPLVSKHRVFQWAENPTLPDHAVGVFARDDDYFIGVLQSRVHVVWSLALGTQLESRPRYTHTTCFETFPFPEPTEDQRDAIADVAKTLMWHRKNVLTPLENTPEKMIREMTLTNVYNKNHRWLRSDHEKLDRAVFDAYGWSEDPADLDDDTILERLLELNLSREPV